MLTSELAIYGLYSISVAMTAASAAVIVPRIFEMTDDPGIVILMGLAGLVVGLIWPLAWMVPLFYVLFQKICNKFKINF